MHVLPTTQLRSNYLDEWNIPASVDMATVCLHIIVSHVCIQMYLHEPIKKKFLLVDVLCLYIYTLQTFHINVQCPIILLYHLVIMSQTDLLSSGLLLTSL